MAGQRVYVYAAGTKRQDDKYHYRFYVGQRPTGFSVITRTGYFYESENYETDNVSIQYWEESRAWPQPSFRQICRLEGMSGLQKTIN